MPSDPPLGNSTYTPPPIYRAVRDECRSSLASQDLEMLTDSEVERLRRKQAEQLKSLHRHFPRLKTK